MSADEVAEQFIERIVWALERILKDEYRETFNQDGTLDSLELSSRINYERDILTPDSLEYYFSRILPPEKLDALLCLKEGRTAADVEKVIHILLSSKLAETALASRTADELAEVDWQEFLLFVNQQFAFSREIGKNFGEVMIREREGFSTPIGRDVEAYLEERRPNDLGLFTARKYAGDFRQLFPEIVERACELRLLPVSNPVPEHICLYLNEGSRCFIFGHFIATLVLCRSVIESALKDRLEAAGHEEKVAQLEKDRKAGFQTFLDLAQSEKLVDKIIFDQAHDIRKLANRAVHPKGITPTQQESKDAFIKTRGILEQLYAADLRA